MQEYTSILHAVACHARELSGKTAVIEAFEHGAASRTQVVVRLEEKCGNVDRSSVRLLLTLDEIEVSKGIQGVQ